MRNALAALLALSILGAASPALAQEFKGGDIVVDHPFARATPKGAEVGGGYLTVHNNGATPDRLTGGTADFAKVEIHQMKSDNGVMTMTALPSGLNLPAHSTIRLAPGGYHIMFSGLTKPFAQGETLTATLTFEKAGPIVVEFPVGPIGAMGGGMGAGMGNMKGGALKGGAMKSMDSPMK